MKIIDLLNKIANKENVPDKIRYRNCIFEKTEGQGISPDYVNNENTFFLEYVSNEADSLNEIVELIEDEEKTDIDTTYWENIGYAIGEIYTCIEKGVRKAFNEEQLDKRTRKEKK
jgi:hypothetical protein